MAEEFDDFEDFDSDIANAAEAEASQEEEAEPAPAPVAAKKTFGRKPLAPAAPAPQRAVPQPAPRAQAPAAVEQPRKSKAMGAAPAQQETYSAYSSPKRYGIYNNITGQIHAEHEDIMMLLLGLAVEMKNDIEDIKESLI